MKSIILILAFGLIILISGAITASADTPLGYVPRITVDPSATINPIASNYNQTLKDLFGGWDLSNFDPAKLLMDVLAPYTQPMGLWFWVLVYAAVFIGAYMLGDSFLLPAFTTIVFSPIFFTVLPADWQWIAGILVAMGVSGLIFTLAKKR